MTCLPQADLPHPSLRLSLLDVGYTVAVATPTVVVAADVASPTIFVAVAVSTASLRYVWRPMMPS
jgi:hypothetical protein